MGNETNAAYNLIGQTDTITFPATGQTGTGRARQVAGYLYVGGPLTSITSFDESNVLVRQVTNSYGLEGETLSVSGSIEPVTNTYDALYRLKTLKDANNNTTTYAYNNIGLVSLISMPGGQTTQFPSYDNDGNLLQRIDGNGVVTNYLYSDPESLLTDIQYPANTSLNVHFGYDTFGRRSSMTDGAGSHSYNYGNLDELLSETTTYTGLAAQAISYAYYPNGSRQTMTTPSGTFSYNYDAAGRPSNMTNPFSEITSWAYQDNDWLQSQTLANGAIANYTYNPVGQLTRLLNQRLGITLSDFSNIGYDGAGNRTSITASITGAPSLNGVTTYQYDIKDQLTQESSTRNGGFTDNFGYDPAGNPTSFKGVAKTYNSNNQETGTGFVHDGNGNPTTYAGTTLTFDPENRMTAHGSALTAGYTGDGLRAWKENVSGRTYFLFDGSVPVIEFNQLGVVTATNTFGTSGLVSRRTGAFPLAVSIFYTFDAQGSVAQRMDGSGLVLSNHLFSAHGSNLSGTLTDPFGYKAKFGYYSDNETGLQLLTHRYYDPSRGRFLTRDPISYEGGVNLYTYSRNNPPNLIDPDGLDVLVIEQGPTEGNPIGHTALAITGRGVFSFGNGGDDLSTDQKGNIMGGDLAQYLYRETNRRDTRLYIIKTTPEQDAAIEQKLREIAANEPQLAENWRLAFDNCSTRSNRGLDAGGIPNGHPKAGQTRGPNIPGSAGLRASIATSLAGLPIPKGAKWQPTIMKQFIRK